jgi:CHAD domain-containing protein
MVHHAVLKPNRSFSENARLLVPVLFDDFLSRRDRVVSHPRLKRDLHRMRIAGKTLRYAMEIFGDAFEDEFSACLEEVKQLLDVMGNVHDCDANIPRLQMQLREIRSFNRVTPSPKDRIRTTALVNLISEQQKLRTAMFADLCAVVQRWVDTNFKLRIVESMKVKHNS